MGLMRRFGGPRASRDRRGEPRGASPERRSHVRVALSAPVRIGDGRVLRTGLLVNVNRQGAMIVPDEAFEPARDDLELEIETEGGAPLSATASLAWSRPVDGLPAIGVRFEGLSSRCRQWVNEAVWIGTG